MKRLEYRLVCPTCARPMTSTIAGYRCPLHGTMVTAAWLTSHLQDWSRTG